MTLRVESGHVNTVTGTTQNRMGRLFSPFEGKMSSSLCLGSCLFRRIVGFPTLSNVYSNRRKIFHGRPPALMGTDRLWLTGAALPAMTMSLEAACDLSIQDLLHVLNEKLSLEWAQIRTIPTSHAVPAASLESEVSTRQPILAPMRSNSHGLHRSTASKPEHTMF